MTSDDPAAREHLVASTLRQLRRTTLLAASFSSALAGRLGIGATDLDCFGLLVDLGPTSAGQLAEVLSLTSGAITGVIDRLEAAGFVTREADPNDRRRVIVRPVAARLIEVQQANQPLLQAALRALAPFADDDLRRVLDVHQRTSALLQEHTARLRTEPSSSSAGTAYSTPRGNLAAGSIEFAGGVSGVSLSASDRCDALYRAVFDGPQPVVRVRDGTVSFGYRRPGGLDFGKRSGRVELNPALAWSIRLRGGASHTRIDARDLNLRELAVSDGASQVQVSVGQARGRVRLCLEGGVHAVQIDRPLGVAAQVQIQGGANRLEFDGQRFGAVGGDLRLATPGGELAPDRYDIEVHGGASRLGIHQV